VYFIDIDDFKQVNDDYGHHVGDEVLRLLAGTISASVVNGGFAGRYGGEEFVVVIPALGEDDARQRARVLVEKVRQMNLAGQTPPRRVTCSIGAVWGHPRAGSSPADLFTAADELMYKAKIAGKNRCCYRSLDTPRDVTVLGDAAELGAAGESSIADGAGHDGIRPDDLRRIAEQLNGSEPTRFATMRKRERHALLAPCAVLCFAGGASDLHEHPGHVRNISTGGVGLITTRPLIRGEPIEIVIEPHTRGGLELHVGGLVAYCRHVQSGIYEVGVQLVVQGRDPIFRDADGVARELDWVMDALRDTQEGRSGAAGSP
jgi:diguanylate cyclase (GGDEF)-like protein